MGQTTPHPEDSVTILKLTKYYWDNEIKEDGKSGTCGTSGGEEKCVQDLDAET